MVNGQTHTQVQVTSQDLPVTLTRVSACDDPISLVATQMTFIWSSLNLTALLDNVLPSTKQKRDFERGIVLM